MVINLTNLDLVREGYNNLKKIIKDPKEGIKETVAIDRGKIIKQVTNIGGAGPASAIVDAGPDVVEFVKDTKVWKYAKYAAIGGAALLVISVLKK